ncbi:MAG: hypothetical protein IPO71_10935 [Nitrosomonas sp.]|nr:hypothetical protein [Nitrosomonas sp.]
MKHEIEIPDLPEGWEAVEILIDPDQYNKYVGDDGCLYWDAKIRMKKKQPRRIVLEETDIDAGLDWNDSIHLDDIVINIQSCKNWKIVEDGKCVE